MVTVLEVATVGAIDVDVLDTIDCQQLAEGTQRAMADVHALANLPVLNLGQLRQRCGASRSGVVVPHCFVGEAENCAIVCGHRPRILPIPEHLVKALAERRENMCFRLPHLVRAGVNGLHVTTSAQVQERALNRARSTRSTPQ